MIGDSTWDAIAAKKVGIGTSAVRSGGFGADELTGAGALGVFDSVADFHRALDAVLGS